MEKEQEKGWQMSLRRRGYCLEEMVRDLNVWAEGSIEERFFEHGTLNEADLRDGYLTEAKAKKKSGLDKFREKHGIVGKGMGLGFSEKEQKFYGWSHRAIVGFGIGDKVFERHFGDENTPFVKHGKKTIKNMDDAKIAATRFARYVA